jgi:Domain of unknown function (DUF222)/HNH endonuclease
MTLVGEAPSWTEDRSDSLAVPLPEGLAEMPPGPELGVVLGGIDRSSLSGDDVVTLMQVVARQVAYYQAELYAAMAVVAHCSSDPMSTERVEAIDEFAAEEIGAALCFTRRAADMHLGLALDLVDRLPAVGEALRQGRIDLARARVICEGTCHLEEAEARRVADVVLEQAPRLTTGQLGARIRRLAMSVQPEMAVRRYEAAVEERRVMCLPNADGTADLVACNLPAEQAAACMRALNTAAHEAKRAGDPRSIDQLRTDILLDRLEVDRSTTGRRGVVDLDIDLTTLAGLDANPAEIPGFGPIVADVARKVAASQHHTEWRVTVTDPDCGTVVWNGVTRRRPTVTQRRYLEARHRCCVFPGCRMPAMNSDIDHTRDFAKGGATDVSNLGPLCRHHHRLKHQGEWRLEQLEPGRFRWTSRLGHVYTVRPGPP